MNDAIENSIYDAAIAWHLRINGPQGDGDSEIWSAFCDWLEQDPAHNAAYEAVVDTDRALDPALALARQDREVRENAQGTATSGSDAAEHVPNIVMLRPSPRGKGWKMPALAASLACVLAIGGAWWMGRADAHYTVATRAGETRVVSLADGSRIELNGATKIVLDSDDSRRARLVSGEARFSIHHDSAHPFTLEAGGRTIEDIGTVFNVRTGVSSLRVEVAQGAVRFVQGITRVRLDAGDTLTAQGDTIAEGHRAPSEIAGWTKGRLVYHDRPLVDVAADITRARGIPIELASNVSDRTFTGVIQLDGTRSALQDRLSNLLNLKVTATADGWTIEK